MLNEICSTLICLLLYVITFCLVATLKKSFKLKYYEFPNLKLKKEGITFFSLTTHRIKIKNAKMMLIKDNLYMRTNERLIIITNITDVKVYENFLYFTAMGMVKIIFDCKDIYRFFAIKIESNSFDLSILKQNAILNLINNSFELNFSKITKKYINIIENVLNIKIFKEKIIVKPNKFKLSFKLSYKLNNQIKQVFINETL